MAGKTWQPSQEPPHSWEEVTVTLINYEKYRGNGGEKPLLHTKYSSSHDTNKQALQPKAEGIWCMRKYSKTTDNNWLQLLLVVNLVKFHLTSFNFEDSSTQKNSLWVGQHVHWHSTAKHITYNNIRANLLKMVKLNKDFYTKIHSSPADNTFFVHTVNALTS